MKPFVCVTPERAVRLWAARALAGLGGILTLGAWLAPTAGAEVTATAQAQIANAGFLLNAVPPGPAAGVCLVDSGVDATPDTSHVVARLALDGDVATDGSPTKHGTSMAMVMGAGLNGFGTVGLFPAVRVVSVRATVAGSESITAAGTLNAINRCNNESVGQGLRVIELALTLTGPLAAEQSVELVAAITAARANGISVVAAAGNNDGGRVENPASQPGVLSVGGSAVDGQRCPGSVVGAVLQAAGCGLDEVDAVTGDPVGAAAGTSQASGLVAGALAALRSWRPELTAIESEQALVQSARPTAGGPLMDVAGAFRRLGLSHVVDAHQPALPHAATVDGPSLTAPSSPLRRSGGRTRLPRPRVQVRAIRRYRGVLVSARNRPRGTVMVVSARQADPAGRLRGVASRARRSGRVALRVAGWDELRMRFRSRAGAGATGPVTVVVHPRRGSPS